MRRYALRDDQWDRIKDFLPGREGHVGARRRIIVCSLKPFFSGIERASLGVIFRRVSESRLPRWAESGVAGC
jgi:transposase